MKGGGGRVSITLHRLASPSNNSDYRIARRPDPLDSQTRAITAHPDCPHSSTRASGRHQPQSAPEPPTATRGHSPTHLSLLRLSLSLAACSHGHPSCHCDDHQSPVATGGQQHRVAPNSATLAHSRSPNRAPRKVRRTRPTRPLDAPLGIGTRSRHEPPRALARHQPGPGLARLLPRPHTHHLARPSAPARPRPDGRAPERTAQAQEEEPPRLVLEAEPADRRPPQAH